LVCLQFTLAPPTYTLFPYTTLFRSNPERFNGDIISMQDEKYAVIIANPETSSLGSVTRQILSTAGVYSEVLNNSIALSVDNRGIDRKSTRLNSSHVKISYAVFCLKK